jgi:raffinose/stachyose/melibiose transport system permease protein
LKRRTGWLLTVAVFAGALIWLAPLLLVVLTAIRSQRDLIQSGVFAWSSDFRLGNFARAWKIGDFDNVFANSAMLIVVKVPLGMTIAAMAAYPLAKMRFRFSSTVLVALMAGLAVPIHVLLLPVALLLKKAGFHGTVWSLLLPYTAFGLPFHVLVLTGFFRTVPTELLEAAELDGCSEWQKFWRILVPLARPAIVTLAIIDVVNTWNELLIALVLIGEEKWQTVPLGLLQFQGEFSSRYTTVMAAVLIAILPIMILYVVFQRYLMSEMAAGALKE